MLDFAKRGVDDRKVLSIVTALEIKHSFWAGAVISNVDGKE